MNPNENCQLQLTETYINIIVRCYSLTNSCEKKRGEKQRRKGKNKHLNAEFQRIARREKKAFFTDQCKEIEEKNRMGKTRDFFKKIRDTKGIFHAKVGSIKD